MRETVDLTGMVLKATPVGDYDRRLVILTRERGKITAFARGAKRPGSQLMAVSRPFVFGRFRLFEGRDAYSLNSSEITNYFTEIAADMEAACYGSYFLELADYFSRENMDGTELLLLLYQSMRALLKPALPNALVRVIFELRIMVINGEYTEHPPRAVSD
jgi:DNA repair protein RecO (recombination protein O)